MKKHPKFETYQDCENAVGLTNGAEPITDHLPEKYKRSVSGNFRAMIVTEAFNEGWEPNYYDGSPKYQVAPRIEASEDKPTGFGFSYSSYDHWDAFANCGSRHTFKSAELALTALEQFPEIFKDYILFK